MEPEPLSLSDQVAMAFEHFEHRRSLRAPDEPVEIETPSPLAYALGWVVGNAIVANRYRESAIDAIPVYHPEQGWDRFLLTRRTACDLRANEPADAFGMILLSGEDAPHLAEADGTIRLSLRSRLRHDAVEAIQSALEQIPKPALVGGDHRRCWHTRAADVYPRLYDVATHLILEFPGLMAAREIHIDPQPVDGVYHPLYLHTGTNEAGLSYGWFGIESSEHVAYLRLHGEQAVRLTSRNTWARASVRDLSWHETKDQVARWLRLGGEPAEDSEE